MSGAAGLELGLALLSGAVGSGWETRALRQRQLMSALFSPTALGLESAPAPGPFTGRPHPRSAVEREARAFVDAFLRRDLDALEGQLTEHVWVAGAEGAVDAVGRSALMERLRSRAGGPVLAVPVATRSYSAAELRSLLPRGVGAAISSFGGPSAGYAVVELRGARAPARRLLCIRAPGPETRFVNLPFIAFDHAAVASRISTAKLSEPERVAHRFVRAFHLGQGRALSELRSSVMERLLVEDEPIDFETLVAELDAGPARLDAVDLSVEPAGKVRTESVWGGWSRLRRDGLERFAREGWDVPWERARPTWVVSKVGKYDLDEERIIRPKPVLSLVLEVEEADGSGARRRRHKLALMDATAPGVELPDSSS